MQSAAALKQQQDAYIREVAAKATPADQIAQADHDPRRQRQLGVEGLEELLEAQADLSWYGGPAVVADIPSVVMNDGTLSRTSSRPSWPASAENPVSARVGASPPVRVPRTFTSMATSVHEEPSQTRTVTFGGAASPSFTTSKW